MNNENVVPLKFTKQYKIWKIILILLFAVGIVNYLFFNGKKEKNVYLDMLYTTVSQIGMAEQVAKTGNPDNGDYTKVLEDLGLTTYHVNEPSYLKYILTKETVSNQDSWVMNVYIPSQSGCKKFLEVISEAQKSVLKDNSGTPFVYWKHGEKVLSENCNEEDKEKYLVQLAVPVGLWKMDNN